MTKVTDRREFLKTSAMALGAAGAACTLPGSVAFAAPAKSKKKRSVKKGLGYGVKDESGWNRLQSVDARWFYNWTANTPQGRPKEIEPKQIEFVPMIWGRGKNLEETCRQLKTQGYKRVLGFNEPDQHDQSNITVEQAIEAWPSLIKSGLQLGSPGCVHPDGDWMKKFMAEAKKRRYRIDFVTAHWYWEPKPEAYLKRLEGVYKLFGLPIWITEFAVADWDASAQKPNRFSPEQVMQFMQTVLPALESANWIQRYAWFSAATDDLHLGTSALFNKDGSLTKVGQCYASL